MLGTRVLLDRTCLSKSPMALPSHPSVWSNPIENLAIVFLGPSPTILPPADEQTLPSEIPCDIDAMYNIAGFHSGRMRGRRGSRVWGCAVWALLVSCPNSQGSDPRRQSDGDKHAILTVSQACSNSQWRHSTHTESSRSSTELVGIASSLPASSTHHQHPAFA